MWELAVHTGHANASRPRQRLAHSLSQPPSETARRSGGPAMLLKWGRERRALERADTALEKADAGARMTPGQGRRREGGRWS
ncbi:hypothetical protein B0H12DRAFT_1155092 [Mycena haematopus]|nr:hypothetical protein B0H12DRAFT_1155092 [Mycena haematopus]